MRRALVKATSLAARQHGAIARRQALDCGLSGDEIRHLVRSGRWCRFDTATYVIPGAPHSWERDVVASLLATDALASASHLTAAFMHGLVPTRPSRIDVTVRHGTQDGKPQGRATIHRARTFGPEDVCRVRGILVTCLPRTLIDIAGVLPERPLAAALDTALVSGRTTIEATLSYIGSRRLRSRRGVGTLSRLLGDRANGVPESELEREFLALVDEFGLPVPVRQKPVGPYRVDFAYPQRGLLVEVDGRAIHGSAAAFDADPERQNALILAGWSAVLRFTWRHVTERRAYVARTIATLLGRPSALDDA